MTIMSLVAALSSFHQNSSLQTATKETELQKAAALILHSMSLEEKKGQMFIIDVPAKPGNDVTMINEDTVETIRKYTPGFGMSYQ